MKSTNSREREVARRLGITCVPILPRHGMYVKIYPTEHAKMAEMWAGRKNADGHTMQPGVTVAEFFLAAWKQIPIGARRAMLKYWRTWPGRLQIRLTNDGMDEYNAMCAHEGFTLKFPPRIEIMPPEHAAKTIAHELAHVYRYATIPLEKLRDEGVERCEVETRKLAESWGFHQDRYERKHYKEELKRERQLAALRAKHKGK
jgi:hypothetical protein